MSYNILETPVKKRGRATPKKTANDTKNVKKISQEKELDFPEDTYSSTESLHGSHVTYEEDNWNTDLPAVEWLTDTYSITNIMQIPKDERPNFIVTDEDVFNVSPGKNHNDNNFSPDSNSSNKQSSATGRTCSLKTYVDKPSTIPCSEISQHLGSNSILSCPSKFDSNKTNSDVSRRTLNKRKTPVKRKMQEDYIHNSAKDSYENTPPILEKEVSNADQMNLLCRPPSKISPEMADPLWISPKHAKSAEMIIEEDMKLESGNKIGYFIVYT